MSEEAKAAMKAKNAAEIKAKLEALNTEVQAMSADLYSRAKKSGAEAGTQDAPDSSTGDKDKAPDGN
jgi:hypothetical protein